MALLNFATNAISPVGVVPSTSRLPSCRRHSESVLSMHQIGLNCVRGWSANAGRCRAEAGNVGTSSVVVAAADEVENDASVVVDAIEQRPLWLPGSTPPAHLDGSLAGDFGFDPLELGRDPDNLRWYVQAELVHARFAMAGVAGILFTDLLRATGRTDVPLWFEAGAHHFDFADTKTLFVVQLLLMGFVETKRWMDFITPGSQAAEDSFFGYEAAFEGLDNGYPGGPVFNPFGLANDARGYQPLRWKEIKNGRLAMVAMVGFIVQAYVTKTGPIENLMTHLSDPLHATILQTVARQ